MKLTDITNAVEHADNLRDTATRTWAIDEHRQLSHYINEWACSVVQLRTRAPYGDLPYVSRPEYARASDIPCDFRLRHYATDFTPGQLELLAYYLRAIQQWTTGLLDQLPPST